MGAVKASGAVQLISGAGRDHTKRFSELAHRRARLRHHLLRHHLRKPGVLGDVSPSRPFSIWLANPHYRERAMPDKPRLREQAREAIRSGGLPVRKDQLEFEVQFARNGDTTGLDRFHIHIRCFAAWEFERGKLSHP